jgi:hypothetical protein
MQMYATIPTKVDSTFGVSSLICIAAASAIKFDPAYEVELFNGVNAWVVSHDLKLEFNMATFLKIGNIIKQEQTLNKKINHPLYSWSTPTNY